MTMQRHVPRLPAAWSGSYRFGREGPLRACRVLDISTAGAGLQLFDTSLDEASDRLVVVSVELSGAMRNAVPWEDGSVRAGIEFTELNGDAAAFVFRSMKSPNIRAL